LAGGYMFESRRHAGHRANTTKLSQNETSKACDEKREELVIRSSDDALDVGRAYQSEVNSVFRIRGKAHCIGHQLLGGSLVKEYTEQELAAIVGRFRERRYEVRATHRNACGGRLRG